MRSNLPADACPYPRPFPPGFDDCPTYDNQLFIPLTSQHDALHAIRSCRFLEAGMTDDGRYYASCALGTEAERAAWLKMLDPVRVRKLKELRTALSAALAGEAERLWAAKARQLKARQRHDPALEDQATDELNRTAAELQERVERFLDGREPALAELRIPRADLSELVGDLLNSMVMSRGPGSGPVNIPPDLLNRFPPEVRAIFRPYGRREDERD